MTNVYVDLNVLQTVPSSNINRDDTGAPKTALYGGVSRSRVSSQSWKHAMRSFFKDAGVNTGTRTKAAAKMLTDQLMALDASMNEKTALENVAAVFKAANIKLDKNNETGALLLVSPGQIEKLAQYIIDHDKLDKTEVKNVLKSDNSLDLALFGRMVASNPELNVEGSAQVAHAISTHEVVPEFDYYTALDDLQPNDAAGAAMLGTVEFNSATLYRYANLNMNELVHNLGSQNAISGAAEFIKAFILSMPTGKQTSFANKTLPNYVMVTIRTDTPVNLVSAFEDAVDSTTGYTQASISKLEEEYQATLSFVDQPALTVVLTNQKYQSELAAHVDNLANLLDQVTEALTKVVHDESTNH